MNNLLNLVDISIDNRLSEHLVENKISLITHQLKLKDSHIFNFLEGKFNNKLELIDFGKSFVPSLLLDYHTYEERNNLKIDDENGVNKTILSTSIINFFQSFFSSGRSDESHKNSDLEIRRSQFYKFILESLASKLMKPKTLYILNFDELNSQDEISFWIHSIAQIDISHNIKSKIVIFDRHVIYPTKKKLAISLSVFNSFSSFVAFPLSLEEIKILLNHLNVQNYNSSSEAILNLTGGYIPMIFEIINKHFDILDSQRNVEIKLKEVLLSGENSTLKHIRKTLTEDKFLPFKASMFLNPLIHEDDFSETTLKLLRNGILVLRDVKIIEVIDGVIRQEVIAASKIKFSENIQILSSNCEDVSPIMEDIDISLISDYFRSDHKVIDTENLKYFDLKSTVCHLICHCEENIVYIKTDDRKTSAALDFSDFKSMIKIKPTCKLIIISGCNSGNLAKHLSEELNIFSIGFIGDLYPEHVRLFFGTFYKILKSSFSIGLSYNQAKSELFQEYNSVQPILFLNGKHI